MLKNSKTEKNPWKTLDYYETISLRKNVSLTLNIPRDCWDSKTKCREIFSPNDVTLASAYFLRLYSVLPEADISEYSIHNFQKYFMHSKDISLDIIVHSTCACYSKYQTHN